MSGAHVIINSVLLIPLAVVITYYDARYRRIPNPFVLATLIAGLSINALADHWHRVVGSLEGCALAFALMFVMLVFGATGAGDVKFFASIGAVLGVRLLL